MGGYDAIVGRGACALQEVPSLLGDLDFGERGMLVSPLNDFAGEV